MIVCICHRVSDRDIAHAARQGCASFDELQDELGVATACGTCGDCARETFAMHSATRSVGLHELGGSQACAIERRIVKIGVGSGVVGSAAG